jgi:hypothetical protein
VYSYTHRVGVAEQVPLVRCRPSSSWPHHDAAAVLDPDAHKAQLAKEVENGLSVSSLAHAVKTYCAPSPTRTRPDGSHKSPRDADNLAVSPYNDRPFRGGESGEWTEPEPLFGFDRVNGAGLTREGTGRLHLAVTTWGLSPKDGGRYHAPGVPAR